MQTSYFQGRDGFIWWHGVVEDRQDPLYLGRCKVRILGWHTEDKSELPTRNLPWAQVLMPVTSASQTNVGHAPVGPVEGTWVMGFYRDGELAQEPVIMGTIPGIPENFAEQGTGFNDPRLDVKVSDLNSIDNEGSAIAGVVEQSLNSYPFPPKIIKTAGGKEAVVSAYTNKERLSEPGGSLYPREVDVPTTSKYARGRNDSSTKLDSKNIISSKNSDLGTAVINIPAMSLSDNLLPLGVTIADGTPFSVTGDRDYLTEGEYLSLRQDILRTKNITQPASAYGARYPFNHVYESESGHLIEQDDTPGKERLHWYHRSGTFTEFHPAGMRVDRTQAHRYNIVTGSYKSIISGEEVKHIAGDSSTEIGGNLTFVSGAEMRISSKDNIIIKSKNENTYIGGKNIILDATNKLILNAGTSIIRESGNFTDKVGGDYTIDASFGGFKVNSNKLDLSSGLGTTTIVSGGSMQQTIAGNSEEIITNKDIAFGNLFAKKITALNGMIGIESTQLIPLSGGINLDVGLLGAMSSIRQLANGDIAIVSLLGPGGIALTATAGSITQFAAAVATLIGSTGTVIGSSSSVTSIEGLPAVGIHLGGTSEPAVLGKKFLELFTKHTHPSSVGPTGVPLNAAETVSVFSKKVFLG